jgi:hypothetical protein
MGMLKVMSNYQHLAFGRGLPDGDTEESLISDSGKKNERVQLLVLCSSRRASFKHRPTQAQVDRLVTFCGKEPQWWIEYV